MQDDLAGLIAPVAWLYERGDGYYTFVETQRWEADRLGGCDNEALNYTETALYPATALETLTRENAEWKKRFNSLDSTHDALSECYEKAAAERDEARAEVERWKDAVDRANDLAIKHSNDAYGACKERDTLRTKLTATQARLDEAVGLLADALTGTRDWQRRRFSFLAQQEGQSNG